MEEVQDIVLQLKEKPFGSLPFERGGPRKEIKDDPVTEQKMDPTYYVTHTSPVKRKVLGDINNTADSPISPTANLKLLTKVASQCDSIENSGVSIASFYSVNGTPPTSELVKSESRNLNSDLQVKGVRKFKSLGFLCDKFLQLYPLDVPEHSHSRILLSDLANLLGVEKRRIYDIINVVESLQMATKVGKNSYMWTGHKKLADTLNQLKVYAKQVGLMQFVRRQQLNRKLYLNLHQGEVESEESCAFVENSNIASFFRNERRIGVLCQKFVMLFLVSLKDGLINLDLAAQALVGEDCQQNKTRLRRLYDIANILVSLGIIAKLDLGGSWKKPVFRYVGPLLLQLEDFSSESPILSSLVKAELSSDGVSSDFSEDGNDLSWKHQVIHSSTKSAEIDHSYSMDLTKNGVKPIAVVEPAAKKRLVFSTDSLNKVPFKVKAEQIALPTQETSTVNTTPTVLRVLGQGSVPQPITNGGVYKAVRVGNDIQLIRIDDC